MNTERFKNMINKFPSDYTVIGGDEELPLGEEFQEHLKKFIKHHEKKVEKRLELVKKLVTQLALVLNFKLKFFPIK